MIPFHAVAGCMGKISYQSKAAALAVIRHQQRNGRVRRAKGVGGLNAYRCGRCHNWHIGTKP